MGDEARDLDPHRRHQVVAGVGAHDHWCGAGQEGETALQPVQQPSLPADSNEEGDEGQGAQDPEKHACRPAITLAEVLVSSVDQMGLGGHRAHTLS